MIAPTEMALVTAVRDLYGVRNELLPKGVRPLNEAEVRRLDNAIEKVALASNTHMLWFGEPEPTAWQRYSRAGGTMPLALDNRKG